MRDPEVVAPARAGLGHRLARRVASTGRLGLVVLVEEPLRRNFHRVTVTVTDADGEQGTDERLIWIGIVPQAVRWAAWLNPDRDRPLGVRDYA